MEIIFKWMDLPITCGWFEWRAFSNYSTHKAT